MSKMSKVTETARSNEKTKRVTNFMAGNSYEINAIDTMKMVTASSIFVEPAYYRNGEFGTAKISDGKYFTDELVKKYSVLDDSKFAGMKTSEIME